MARQQLQCVSGQRQIDDLFEAPFSVWEYVCDRKHCRACKGRRFDFQFRKSVVCPTEEPRTALLPFPETSPRLVKTQGVYGTMCRACGCKLQQPLKVPYCDACMDKEWQEATSDEVIHFCNNQPYCDACMDKTWQ